MMNQIHIGVVVPVMENGRIQPFQAQYPMTPSIITIQKTNIVSVWDGEGTHILHTLLYYENV